ncbi:hypothetical protein GCM10017673_15790 [Streptosporangium violaceochromogenes]|nr:hypothetical protein GCM10017673_15790 [Streptosporangium violaceochromogenes]
MSANNPPGPPSSSGPEPDRTIAYRRNEGAQQSGQQHTQAYPQPGYPPHDQPGYPPQGGGGYQQQAQSGYPNQPGHDQQPYGGQPGYQNQGHAQQGYGQGYDPNSHPQAGYPQAGYPQAGHPQPGHPQPGYQNPGQQPGWQPQAPDFLGSGHPPAPPARKGGKGVIIAVVAALVIALVGGGTALAVNLLSGGGTQPHEVLPGNALGYMRLDLDPAANQKLALFGIARKFNLTKDAFTGDDPRKALFDLIKKDSGTLSKVDFATDVEPWLGQRVGMAVLPPAQAGGDPEVVAAVQVTDEAKAKAGIAKLMDGGKYGLTFRDEYALLAETQAQTDRAAQATPLSAGADFSGDLGALGETGVLSFWVNAGKVAELAPQLATQSPEALAQIKNMRVAGALRFDGDYVELAGVTRGAQALTTGDPEVSKIGALPASTVGAVSVSGLGEAIGKQWTQLMKSAEQSGAGSFQQFADQAQQKYGLALPADLTTLIGKNITLAVDANGLDGDQPRVGARLTTDPAKAQEVVGKIERFLADSGTVTPQIAKVPGDDFLVLASSQEYAAELAKDGTLGEDEGFKLAVPDADKATFAAYVDLDKIERFYLANLQGEEQASLKVLRAVGISGTQSGGDSTFSMRLLFN